MAHVTVTIHGRPHRLECGEGDVERIGELGAYLQAKIDKLTEAGGSVPYDRLMVMAALLVTDELFEMRAGAGDPMANSGATDPITPGQVERDGRARGARGGRPGRLAATTPIAGE